LIIEGELLRAELVQPLLDEANELTSIMTRSHMTAAARATAKNTKR